MDIEELYKKYGAMVYRRCTRLLKDRAKAEDAMQDTFVRLIRYKHKLNAKYPSSLLYTMATNVCLNIIRKQNLRNESLDDEFLSNIQSREDIHAEIEARDMLERIFEGEKKNTALMATLYYLDGMTYQEVAETVNMSVSGIRKRLRLLKESLRKKEKIK